MKQLNPTGLYTETDDDQAAHAQGGNPSGFRCANLGSACSMHFSALGGITSADPALRQ